MGDPKSALKCARPGLKQWPSTQLKVGSSEPYDRRTVRYRTEVTFANGRNASWGLLTMYLTSPVSDRMRDSQAPGRLAQMKLPTGLPRQSYVDVKAHWIDAPSGAQLYRG